VTYNIFQYIVIIFGAAISAACVGGIVSPSDLIGWVRKVFDNSWGLPVAIGVRLFLGVVFILVAPATTFPGFFEVVGVIAIVAAAALPFVGKERLRKLMAWVEGWPVLGVRLWLLLGAAFGAFVIYAVTWPA
jgi:hypothetical protein